MLESTAAGSNWSTPLVLIGLRMSVRYAMA
jgi:hypothetical protein